MSHIVSDRTVPSDWDDLIAGLGGSIFHSVAWAKYTCAGPGSSSARWFRMLHEDGRVLGAALGLVTQSQRRLLGALTRQIRFDAMGALAEDSPAGRLELLRGLEQQARKLGCVEMHVGSFASFAGGEELRQLGFTATDRLEFELDLTASEDDIWGNMEHKRRKNIRKAERMGVRIEDLQGKQGVAELRRLQGDSSERIMARGGRDIRFKGGGREDPVTVLLDLGLGRLVGAKLDGEIVSAGLFTCFNGLVYHTLSGHSSQALKSQAPTLLLWETIKRYKAQGAARLNFGGCGIHAVQDGDPEHGIYSYKKAFGGRCLTCTSGRKVLRPLRRMVFGAAKRVLGS